MWSTMAAARPSNDLVTRVVAWHNRNPLARRITSAHVMSVGLVSFPFFVPASQGGNAAATGRASPTAPAEPAAAAAPPAAGGSLRERARAQAGGPHVAAAPTGVAAAAATAAAAAAAAAAAGGARRRGWRPAFEDDILDPDAPARLARWAIRHGSVEHPGPPDAPVRELVISGRLPAGSALVHVWLFTAAIDLGSQRVRVLVAPADARHVLGPRIMGRRRVGAVAAALGALATGIAALALGLDNGRAGTGAASIVVQAAAGVSASAAASAAASVAASLVASAEASAEASAAPAISVPVPADAPAASAASAPASSAAYASASPQEPTPQPSPRAKAPVSASAKPAASSRARTMRHVVPFLSEPARQAAREEGDALRAEARERVARAVAARGDSPPLLAQGATVAPAGSTAPAADPTRPHTRPRRAQGSASTPLSVGPPPPGATTPATTRTAPGQAWAVSTRSLRTRFESEQMVAALRDVAYRSGHGKDLKLEVLPSGDDWRAVGWPFASRAEAERMRAALAARGLKAEVVQF